MKNINKSFAPNELTRYAQNFPTHSWNDFRNSAEYKGIKKLIFSDQGNLCAFCESAVTETHKQRVEHFHPKSDTTNTNHNWALDWTNVIGVCLGGSDVDKSAHPLPANLSCDAYKDHLINQNKLPIACEGHLINPLTLSAFPCLFDLDRRTGRLKAKDEIDYEKINISDNYYKTVAELVEKTIEHLNLNCDRLNQQRLAVLHQFNQEIAKARKRQDRDIFIKLAERWFQPQWASFFTTRRILLNEHAENYLAVIGYTG